jgi:hypothetical protein
MQGCRGRVQGCSNDNSATLQPPKVISKDSPQLKVGESHAAWSRLFATLPFSHLTFTLVKCTAKMQQTSSPVSPVEYSALPNHDDFRPSAELPQPDRLKEPQSQSNQREVEEEPDGRPQPTKEVPLTHHRSSSIWWLEAGCCSLVVGGLVGIIATVSSLDNKPLPQWPYGLSINTFIAAFSVLIKASSGLVLAECISHIKWTNLRKPQSLQSFKAHDEASRGPWGALVLLWNDHGRSVSSLGSLITILVLFLEPFSQQIVSFVDCERVHEHGTATIPRTNRYELEGLFESGNGANLVWDVRNSVNQGIFATNKPQMRFTCQPGNCT